MFRIIDSKFHLSAIFLTHEMQDLDMNDKNSPPPANIVSHMLVVAEDGDNDFQVRRCNGFDETAIHRFGNVPCVVHLQLRRSSVPEISQFDKLTDVSGIKEACNLALRIRTSPVPLRARHSPVSKMPSFDKVNYQDGRLAWLRTEIKIDKNSDVLKIRNKIYGFSSVSCSHLKNSIIFPEIKKIAERWNFDMNGTIFE